MLSVSCLILAEASSVRPSASMRGSSVASPTAALGFPFSSSALSPIPIVHLLVSERVLGESADSRLLIPSATVTLVPNLACPTSARHHTAGTAAGTLPASAVRVRRRTVGGEQPWARRGWVEQQVGDQGGPPGLMHRPEAGTVVTVEVLVEQQVVLP